MERNYQIIAVTAPFVSRSLFNMYKKLCYIYQELEACFSAYKLNRYHKSPIFLNASSKNSSLTT